MGLLYEIKNSIDNLASKIENIQEDVGILKALQYPCPSETQETCQADDQSPKIQIVNKTQPQITPQENQLPHWPIQSLEEVDRVIRNFENEQYKDSVVSVNWSYLTFLTLTTFIFSGVHIQSRRRLKSE